jgi:hypothetical protein
MRRAKKVSRMVNGGAAYCGNFGRLPQFGPIKQEKLCGVEILAGSAVSIFCQREPEIGSSVARNT